MHKKIKDFHTKISKRKFVYVGLTIITGLALILTIRAANPVAFFEAESGSTQGNSSVLSDSAASSGKYLKFGASTSGDGTGDTGDTGGTGGTTLNNGFTRESLLSERAGFGRFAGGTGNGSADDALTWSEYVVTSTNINATGSGTLRGALSSGQRWITFKKGLTIDQATTSAIKPSTGRWVIDGRGADITIRTQSSNNFVILNKDNWIITNLTFRLNASASSSPDMIQNEASNHWWVHKVTFVGIGPGDGGSTGDGALDTGGATISGTKHRPDNGTVSWCKFLNHGKLTLAVWEVVNGETPLPSSRSDMPKYTYHHNLFRNNRQRQPLTRSSLLDFVNNWVDGWGVSGSGQAVQANEKAQALIRNNIFDATYRTNATNYKGGPTSNGYIKNGGGNLLSGGATISTNNASAVFDPSSYYSFPLDTANQALRDAMEANAGAR